MELNPHIPKPEPPKEEEKKEEEKKSDEKKDEDKEKVSLVFLYFLAQKPLKRFLLLQKEAEEKGDAKETEKV